MNIQNRAKVDTKPVSRNKNTKQSICIKTYDNITVKKPILYMVHNDLGLNPLFGRDATKTI